MVGGLNFFEGNERWMDVDKAHVEGMFGMNLVWRADKVEDWSWNLIKSGLKMQKL